MKLNIQWLKEILPKIPSNNKLCDKLTSIGLEVSNSKTSKHGFIIDIDITPNRSDCLSVFGIARDLSAAYRQKILAPKASNINIKKSNQIIKSVNKKISPHYTCLTINGINNRTKTPSLIRDRLESCGITSINLIVDILNYVMVELGQPFHAFDNDTLDGKLNVRFSKKNEIIDSLNDKKYALKERTPVIADKSKVHAIAGIIGSKNSAVTKSSKNIIIECAHFLPELIRSASKEYRIQTDSSYRFERGVDPLSHKYVLSRVIYFIKKYTTYQDIKIYNYLDKSLDKSKNNKIVFNTKQVYRILGKKIGNSEIRDIFKYLGFTYKQSKEKFNITIPSYRFDISNEYDLIEEIARIIGFDQFKAQIPSTGILNKKIKTEIFPTNKISSLLISRGYNEIKSYSFLPKDYQREFVSNKSINIIQNPISEDKAEMRVSLLPSLVRTYQYNANRQQKDIKVFEIGKTYQKNSAGKIFEIDALSGLISGQSSESSLKVDSKALDFFDLKGDLISILPNIVLRKTNISKFLNSEIQANIIQNNKQIGICGQISNLLCAKESVENKLFAFEITLNQDLFPENIKYAPISQFPKIRRDLTILIDDKIPGTDIIDIITRQSYKYLIYIKINDVFYDRTFDSTKKSLSLELHFQNKSATLVDADVNLSMTKILELLQKKFDAKLRT